MTLPGGFSIINAGKQIGSQLNPTGGVTDYNVFSEKSVRGGDRSPADGSFFGADPTRPAVAGEWETGSGSLGPAPSAPRVAPADPYARWGGQAAYNAQRNTFGATQGGYEGGARQTLTDAGNTYDQKTRGLVNEVETGQGDINRGLGGNQLNLRQSMRNIIAGIQQGIRSGGVMLANGNAMDSGASDAMARAYAKVGNNQTGEARGEAATVNEDLQRQQGQLNQKRNEGVSDLNTYRDTETGRVRSDLGNKLDLLGSQAEGAGFGGVVDRGITDRVIGDALARFMGIDQGRDQKLAGIRQWTPDEIMAEALRLEEIGQPGQAFSVEGPNVNYGGGAPAGAPLGQMPVYAKGRDELAVVPKRDDQ